MRRTNRFLPPRYTVRQLACDTDAAWQAIAPLPLLTDLHGEEIPPRDLAVRVAWDAERLHLRVECRDEHVTLAPAEPPDGPQFWRQDHIELRLLPDPRREQEQIQIILAPDGRVFDGLGLWKSGAIRAAGEVIAGGWRASLSVRFADLGLAAPAAGDVLRGLIAHMRWAQGRMDAAATSAAELGFAQADRFAEFTLASGPAAVELAALTFDGVRLVRGRNRCRAVMVNHTDGLVATRVFLVSEGGDDTAGRTTSQAVTLPPGETRMDFDLDLQRPQFTRFSLRVSDAGGLTRELAAVSLRAAPAPINPAELGLQHPILMFRDDVVREIREKATRPPMDRMRRYALLPPVEHLAPLDEAAFAAMKRPLRNRQLVTILTGDHNGWVLDGRREYIDHATQYIRSATPFMAGDSGTNELDDSKLTVHLPIVYDTFWPHLSPADRGDWRRFLELYLERYLRTARWPHWDATAIPNANPCCNSGGAMLALVLHDHPDAAEALYLARKYIGHHLDYCLGVDGVNTEWMQYADFAWSTTLKFAQALELATGSDDGLLSHPGMMNAGNAFRLALSNTGRCTGFNDTFPSPIAGPIAWRLGARYGDRFLLWYGDHALRYAQAAAQHDPPTGYTQFHADAITYAYRPDMPEQFDQPPLPLAHHSRDVEVALVRSGTNYDCRWVASFKGSRPPYTHHNQADTGSYILDLRGEDFIIDTGYFRPEPTDHSLPIIGGVGPCVPAGWECTGTITACRAQGDLRYMACDSAAAYRGAARRVVRHLVLAGEEAAVLLDDVAPHDPAAVVMAQYQAGGQTEDVGVAAPGRALVIRRRAAAMRLDLLTRPELKLTIHPLRTYDHHWGWYHTDCQWHPVNGGYTADERDPLVTVFLDVTEGVVGPASLRRCGEDMIITLPSGRSLTFTFALGRWCFTSM